MPETGRAAIGAPVSRRRALAWLGAAGLSAAAAACSKAASSSVAAPQTTATTTGSPLGGTGTTTATAAGTCVLTPEQTEGPFFIPGEAVRTDITEGKPGTPLQLALVVVDVSTCRAVANAMIDIWHADATGNYSGFNGTASNRTFLRGVQVTDAAGAAGFHTIYPGWYQGRATHIHVKVYLGGTAVHTGQLYFDEAVNSAVYASAPYGGRGGARTLNRQDSIYASGGAQSLLRISPEGSGFLGAATLGVASRGVSG